MSVTTGAAPQGGGTSQSELSAGASTPQTPLPVPTACADPTSYDIPATEPDRVLQLSAGTGALSALQLTPADLGAGWAEAPTGTLIGALPGFPNSGSYADVDARSLRTDQNAASASWTIHQTTVQMKPGQGSASWQEVTDRLLCTTPEHAVRVLDAGEHAGARWLVVRHTLPTKVTRDRGNTLPDGPAVTQWRVIVNQGDLLTIVDVDRWGGGEFINSELPTPWAQALARATVARLTGQAPNPMPTLQ
ncbi:hypothetical protein [Motilibacter aurantiacus]|uniref:hypothetical protein n=1 Tax=Motilibacter aurantiacus TaxID=2714955 RepID=UPI00140D989C|nr:hypothetical protein [Motilibacter aurantiacus]NHC47627.1 hypothetical protein [Motilibacter aurantiacus]